MPTKLVADCTTGTVSEVELTAQEIAQKAIDDADPNRIVYTDQRGITSRLTTTGTTSGELFRRPLATLTGYIAAVDLVGIDRGNGNMRYIKATVVVKRLNNGAVLVGAPVVLANHTDGAAGTWTITPSVSGNEFIISCVGASGRTVDWFLRMQVDSFTPGGQP